MPEQPEDIELFWMAMGDGMDTAEEGWMALAKSDEALLTRWKKAVDRADREVSRMVWLAQYPFLAKALLRTRQAWRKGLQILSMWETEEQVAAVTLGPSTEEKGAEIVDVGASKGPIWKPMREGEIVTFSTNVDEDDELCITYQLRDQAPQPLEAEQLEETLEQAGVTWELESGEAPVLLTFELRKEQTVYAINTIVLVEEEHK